MFSKLAGRTFHSAARVSVYLSNLLYVLQEVE
jgi:hypothetical protein